MKIAIASDIHLEFGPITLENNEGADVLILSGDICVERDLMDRDPNNILDFRKSTMIHEFFYNCCNVFPHVVYIVGNHEHYHGDFAHTIKELKRKLSYLPNLQILDKEAWTLHDEITFIGGTLWTDMNKEDPLTLHSIRGMMNDFRCVSNSNREVSYKTFDITEDGKQIPTFRTRASTFCPEDAVEDHKKMVQTITKIIEGKFDHKFVVVGHHAPSKLSTHPRYKDEQLMNGGYSSDLSEFIMDHPQIKLWTHGHTHEDFDYMLGSTRIVCNPRGYINYEDRADSFKLKVVEV